MSLISRLTTLGAAGSGTPLEPYISGGSRTTNGSGTLSVDGSLSFTPDEGDIIIIAGAGSNVGAISGGPSTAIRNSNLSNYGYNIRYNIYTSGDSLSYSANCGSNGAFGVSRIRTPSIASPTFSSFNYTDYTNVTSITPPSLSGFLTNDLCIAFTANDDLWRTGPTGFTQSMLGFYAAGDYHSFKVAFFTAEADGAISPGPFTDSSYGGPADATGMTIRFASNL